MKKILFPCLIMLFALTNYINNVEDNTGEEQTGINYAQTVQPIFNARCVACHGFNEGVNLFSYAPR